MGRGVVRGAGAGDGRLRGGDNAAGGPLQLELLLLYFVVVSMLWRCLVACMIYVNVYIFPPNRVSIYQEEGRTSSLSLLAKPHLCCVWWHCCCTCAGTPSTISHHECVCGVR